MDIEVTRDELATARKIDAATAEPDDGEAVFRIDSFALTANNVTYGAVGDLVGYWNFYPASEVGWGRIPVWGFADVTASRAEGVDVGDRYFGFWPMSTEAVLRPGSIGPTGFTDVTPHRVALPAIYNRYSRTPSGADTHAEALTSLLRPLFATSFLIDAWLADEDVFGADSVVISSASSKTALGLAYLLKTNGRATVVGLTSPSNVGFVEDTDAYDRIVPYGDLPGGLGDGTAVYVDFAGSADVLSAVHHHFDDRLQQSVTVGFTHRAAGDNSDLPGPAPEFFFAPDHIVRRMEQWGGHGMAERIDAARVGFDAAAGATIEVVERTGADEIIDSWTAAVDGGLDPRHGLICRW
jgi:hypothetical protein